MSKKMTTIFAIINTSIAVFTILCVGFGSWMTVKLTTQALQKDFAVISKQMNVMDSHWQTVPKLKLSHETFIVRYEFEQRDICRRIDELTEDIAVRAYTFTKKTHLNTAYRFKL